MGLELLLEMIMSLQYSLLDLGTNTTFIAVIEKTSKIPRKVMTRMSSTANHKVMVSRMSPAISQLRIPIDASGSVHPLVKVTVHNLICIIINDIIVSWGNRTKSATCWIQGSEKQN